MRTYTLSKTLQQDVIDRARQSVDALNQELAARFPQNDYTLIGWISDIHIHQEEGYESQSISRLYREEVDTRRQLALALHEVDALGSKPAFVMLGGDLTDYGFPEEFATLKTLLDKSPLTVPTMPMFGNHDNGMLQERIHPDVVRLWPELKQPHWPDIADPIEFYYSFEAAGLSFIVLDTMQKSSYRMSDRQKTWLKSTLASLDKPTIVFCHRHQLSVGNWVDAVSTFEDREVWEMLNASPYILGCFSGHVHYPRLWQLRKKLYCTFPALAYGIGAGTGWGGLVIREGRIAGVFYKEIFDESFDMVAGVRERQAGKFVFMTPELYENSMLCHPGHWFFRARPEERD